MTRLPWFALALALTVVSVPALAQPAGHVQIPIEVYEALLSQSRSGAALPVGYAFESAAVQSAVTATGDRARATVTVDVSVQILESEWTLVPVLPAGTVVTMATVDGGPMFLLPSSAGLIWATNRAGTFRLRLIYELDAFPSEGGQTLALPLPPARSTQLTATLPGTGLDVAVIPGARVTTAQAGSNTTVSALVPSSSGVQLTWRTTGASEAPTVSRASYAGRLVDQAVTWRAEYRVEMANDGPVTVDLLRINVALMSLMVDGEEAPIIVNGGSFAVSMSGQGAHTVVAEFQSSVGGAQGRPHVTLNVPRVPVSRFALTLPGEKDITVEPAANVESVTADGETVSVVHLPMSEEVTFYWLEAVPELEADELVANASIYHAAWAEEGVLTVRAVLDYEITRGEATQFSLSAPEGAQINHVTSQDGAVVDWRLVEVDGERVVTVFLGRSASGEFRFEVEYELLLGSAEAMPSEVVLPLLHARDVSRQRGMVALLSNRELTLEPVREVSLTRVGENQLPAFVRDSISMTIAHTFRYFEARPELAVRAQAPERRQARFDARVDTLVSLGDVTTNGAASVEIQVKSGTTMALDLYLPEGVNLLSLSAPSLRDYRVEPAEGEQRIAVEFTQEMEGQFRIEVTYERISADDAEVPIPLLRIAEAEVEQGRVAVEALSAVEVRPGTVDHLSSVEFSELPQQLILRTTNPILLAFRYVQAEPRPSLTLRVTRHREVEVQAAVIDLAHYRTLVTSDGFAVTIARFTVRNSREQFLRVRLPASSEVWSASVNGEAETPALANSDDEAAGTGPEVLINIINSAAGFPVELVYVTQLDSLGLVGAIEAELPRPDMVVTQTRWDVDVPADLRYGQPRSELDVVAEGVPVYGSTMDLDSVNRAGSVIEQPLGLSVPESGVRFSFEKLYANQAGLAVHVRIPYSSREAGGIGTLLTILGAILFWLGLVALLRKPRPVGAGWLAAGVLGGAALVIGAVMVLDSSLVWPLRLSVVAILALAVVGAAGPLGRWYKAQKAKVEARRAEKAATAPPVPAPEALPVAPPPPAPPAPPAGDEPEGES